MRYTPAQQPLSWTLFIAVLLLASVGVEQSLVMLHTGGVAPEYAISGVACDFIEYLFGEARVFLDRLALLLLFGVALYTIRITVGKMVLGIRCYLSAVFYTLLVLVASKGEVTFEAALSAIIFAKGCSLYIQSFRRDTSSYDYIFRAGFALGITPLLFGQMLLLFPLTLIACIAFRRSTKEYGLTLTGYILPFIICSYVCWMIGYDANYVALRIWENIYNDGGELMGVMHQPLDIQIFIGFYILMSIIATVFFYGRVDERRNSSIRMFTVFISSAILMTSMLVLPDYTPMMSTIAAIPFSIVIPAFFITFRNKLSITLYVLMLLCGIGIYAIRLSGLL